MHRRVRPLVSFVVPVRSDAVSLRRCLASIVANDYPRALLQIVVVDNGSVDDSVRVAREYGATVVHGPGDSVARLRNRGARASIGAIIAFADADHAIDPHWVTTAVEVLASPGVAATGWTYLADPAANWVQRQYDAMRARPGERRDVTWLASGNLAVTRAAFERVGGFDSRLVACEDVDLSNRLRLAGYRLVADPGLRSVHFGDPKTLGALFLGELWRGRDNLTVALNGPRTFRHLRSALVPVVGLAALLTGLAALVLGHPGPALVALAIAAAPSVLKAAFMLARGRPTATGPAQALAVAAVYDLARALALVTRGSHRGRRAASS